MLRSVLVAAFSAVVAFGTLNGLSTAKDDARAQDSTWSVVRAGAPADHDVVATPGDSVWS
ncbi:hypothetical protein AQI88_28635 [Streptomyces cellostaticus]|uniref:Uncharacterized protein n=1 Tax=Streptomyces cellostaticus TaxID=67285 RepID=A0A101NHB1_9ACTN|nr:hypothetical protein [Streptomyces cellostaticus]KUM93087.1 hypothetical protein AQI88_28635 [Streptomyces cellostaticus]